MGQSSTDILCKSSNIYGVLCSMTTDSISKPLVQHCSLIFKHVQQKNQHILGVYSSCDPQCLSWAYLLALPSQYWDGTHCFFKVTSFRYLVAFQSVYPPWPGQFHRCPHFRLLSVLCKGGSIYNIVSFYLFYMCALPECIYTMCLPCLGSPERTLESMGHSDTYRQL